MEIYHFPKGKISLDIAKSLFAISALRRFLLCFRKPASGNQHIPFPVPLDPYRFQQQILFAAAAVVQAGIILPVFQHRHWAAVAGTFPVFQDLIADFAGAALQNLFPKLRIDVAQFIGIRIHHITPGILIVQNEVQFLGLTLQLLLTTLPQQEHGQGFGEEAKQRNLLLCPHPGFLAVIKTDIAPEYAVFPDGAVEHTVAEIETALRVIINEQNCDLDADNTALYDVVLMYSTDGGQTWTRADEEHFPEDGKLLISLGVPAGTSTATHDYYVVHMFSKDAFGKKAGDVEYPAVTERDGHIEFYVTGLSPILVGWTDTSSTAPGGHSFTNKASNVKATDATCTEAATYYVQCDNCTEHTTEKTVPVGEPLGHDWDEGTVTTKPTCEKDGIRTFTCKRDNTHTDTKAEPATGHSFTKYESNNDATCKKDGTETAKCDHGCGKTDTRTDKGSKLGHKYEDGKCVRCGLSWWSPETGDKIMIAVVTLIVSGAALLLLFAWKKKKRKQ